MIKAEFKENKESGSITMRMRGHAGADNPGHDVVCAGASTLAYTLAQCMRFMREQGKLQKEPNMLLRNGRAEITAKPKDEAAYAEALHTFFVVQVGLTLLQENYQDFVQVTRFDQAQDAMR